MTTQHDSVRRPIDLDRCRRGMTQLALVGSPTGNTRLTADGDYTLTELIRQLDNARKTAEDIAEILAGATVESHEV